MYILIHINRFHDCRSMCMRTAASQSHKECIALLLPCLHIAILHLFVQAVANQGKSLLQAGSAMSICSMAKLVAWPIGLACELTAVCGRMYATAAARHDGLLLLCGGRDAENVPLGDAYGLARHRDGRWEWAAAPGETKPFTFHAEAIKRIAMLALLAAWHADERGVFSSMHSSTDPASDTL